MSARRTCREGFESGWSGTPYPPPGYLPWSILDVGNEDTYGYYWPIGKENDPPLVCTIMHDAWALLPVASNLASFVRLHLLTGGHGDTAQLIETARDFGIKLDDIPLPDPDDANEVAPLDGPPWTDPTPKGIEFWGAASATELLAHDTNSPQLRLVAAKEAIAQRRSEDAKEQLVAALTILPEYSEAWALLAQVHRQQQDLGNAAEAMMQAITSPICFGGRDRKKLLNWLQRMKDDPFPNCIDPFWQRRSELTFAEGVRENNDYRLFEELIEEYHKACMGLRAVRLRLLSGELMGHETIWFRERERWEWPTFWSNLRKDFERAGLQERLVAVESQGRTGS